MRRIAKLVLALAFTFAALLVPSVASGGGRCPSGYTDIGTTNFPGLGPVAVCLGTRGDLILRPIGG